MKCPFCENEVDKFHPNSHVVPEWMYKTSFGQSYKVGQLDQVEEELILVQKGFTASFICEGCETDFSKDDTYGSRILGNRTEWERVVLDIQDKKMRAFKLIDFDFKRFQKFVLGVVLRGHLAKVGKTNDLLGEKHYLRMRKVYKDDSNFDPRVYPIAVNKVPPQDPLQIAQPSRGKNLENLNIVAFRGAGYEIDVVVQNQDPPDHHWVYLLNSDRLLVTEGLIRLESSLGVLLDAKKLWRGNS